MLTQAMKAPPNKPVNNPKIKIVGFEACRLNRYDKIPKPATPVKLASKITVLYHAVLNPAVHDFLYQCDLYNMPIFYKSYSGKCRWYQTNSTIRR
jgi:hypothetical protein